MSPASYNSKRVKLTLQEEGQERDHEHEEDTDDAVVDPLERRREVVAADGTDELSGRRVLADRDLVVQRTKEDHCERPSVSTRTIPPEHSSTYS